MSDDFDETILEDEERFKKRFRRIERPGFIDKAIKDHKNRITIYLDWDVIEHFKSEAEKSRVGYQTLINQTLRASIRDVDESDLLEKLLKDKRALKRLKTSLETV